MKGNSATGRTKPATLETGLVVQLPEPQRPGDSSSLLLLLEVEQLGLCGHGEERDGGDGEREVLTREGLPFHGDVALGVGGGAPDDGDIDGADGVEQPFLALDLDHPTKLEVALAELGDRLGHGLGGPLARLAGHDELSVDELTDRTVSVAHPISANFFTSTDVLGRVS